VLVVVIHSGLSLIHQRYAIVEQCSLDNNRNDAAGDSPLCIFDLLSGATTIDFEQVLHLLLQA
jgi:hypothetical protein